MTQEEVRNKMQEELNNVTPIVQGLIMDAYQEGFKTCWELLTGQSWEQNKEKL
jgi:hypothetical protein